MTDSSAGEQKTQTPSQPYTLKEGRGNLFKSEVKNKDNSPDYFGKVNVDGKSLNISGWITEAKSGRKYINLSVSHPTDAVDDNDDASADLPF